ncbi:hypothetical protein ACWDYJ_35110 [Streptomyces sp. NPDC003042]
MAELRIDGDDLVVRLAWWEKAAARRGNIRVPVEAVARVAVQPDWWRALRGVREDGLLIAGTVCVGTWRHAAGRDFFAIRPRLRRAVVCVDLWPRPGVALSRICVSSPQAERSAASVKAAAGGEVEGERGRSP